MALDLLVRSAQNRKKCTFLDNLRTITQEGNIEQITLVGDGVEGEGSSKISAVAYSFVVLVNTINTYCLISSK